MEKKRGTVGSHVGPAFALGGESKSLCSAPCLFDSFFIPRTALSFSSFVATAYQRLYRAADMFRVLDFSLQSGGLVFCLSRGQEVAESRFSFGCPFLENDAV